jgi:AraC-like DNA-binding protein
MYDQIREDPLFILLYGAVTAMSVIAGCYLLFRRSNAIAPDVTPPIRLRRWTAAFFASIVLNHLWYMPILFLTSSEDILITDLIGGLLDCMTVIPLALVVLLTMLQDRKRPLWPVAVMVAPIIVGSAWSVATRSYALLPMLYAYFLLMGIGFIIYMVRALRQYGRWLRDNYADLEHKEVWQILLVLGITLLVFAIYVFTCEGTVYLYAMQVINVALVCFLLWRVETLSDLGVQVAPAEGKVNDCQSSKDLPQATLDRSNMVALPTKNIEQLLQRHCIDTQLYLQHDLSLLQLAKAVGTNRYYLSQYFSSLDMNYNTYINDLRINHFVSLYREALDTQRSFTVQQLALESGYRSYSTFSDVIRRKTGKSVRAWMKELGEP